MNKAELALLVFVIMLAVIILAGCVLAQPVASSTIEAVGRVIETLGDLQ